LPLAGVMELPLSSATEVPRHLVSSNPSLSARLTEPVAVEVQLELSLPEPVHVPMALQVRNRGPRRNRLPMKGEPREVSVPSGVSGIQGLETVIPAPVVYDDPTRVLAVKNELTGQVWNFKDVGSMMGPDGAFMLRGHWDPGIYRIENRTGAVLRLTLWNVSHDIAPGETWRFGAHGEIGKQAEMIEKRRLH